MSCLKICYGCWQLVHCCCCLFNFIPREMTYTCTLCLNDTRNYILSCLQLLRFDKKKKIIHTYTAEERYLCIDVTHFANWMVFSVLRGFTAGSYRFPVLLVTFCNGINVSYLTKTFIWMEIGCETKQIKKQWINQIKFCTCQIKIPRRESVFFHICAARFSMNVTLLMELFEFVLKFREKWSKKWACILMLMLFMWVVFFLWLDLSLIQATTNVGMQINGGKKFIRFIWWIDCVIISYALHLMLSVVRHSKHQTGRKKTWFPSRCLHANSVEVAPIATLMRLLQANEINFHFAIINLLGDKKRKPAFPGGKRTFCWFFFSSLLHMCLTKDTKSISFRPFNLINSKNTAFSFSYKLRCVLKI